MPVIFMERSLLDSLTEADIKEITTAPLAARFIRSSAAL